VPHVPQEERRPQLVAAAIRVIAREGVARATTRRIAEEAGTALATLHYAFRDKAELFAAVTEYGVRRTEEALAERRIAPGIGLAEAVAEIVTLFRDWTAAEPGLQAAQLELQAWSERTPAFRELADHCYVTYGRAFVGVLRAAATAAEDRVDLDRLATLTLMTTDGMALRILASGPSAMADVDVRTLAVGLVAAAGEYPSTDTGSTD
jgi:TetR/AcrR family transcriptional regulator, regulator of biofilm formation and stress response